MAVFNLCKDDDLVKTLRSAFKMNVVRIPKKRVRPLTVIAKKGLELKVVGSLDQLLVPGTTLDITVHQEPVSKLAGNKTRSVDFSFGIEILDGFLKAYGLSGASLKETFNWAKEVSFQFEEVQEFYVDALEIGQKVKGLEVDFDSPAVQMFTGPDQNELLLVDAVMASKSFGMKIDKAANNETEVELGAIKKIVKLEDAKVAVDWKNNRALTFAGEEYLTFAFGCTQLYIDPATRKIVGMDQAPKDLVLESTGTRVVVAPEEPVMLEFEE